MTDTPRYDEFLLFAHKLCEAASRATLPLFRNLSGVENKLRDGFDPVTEADRAAEAAIRALIETHYPSHAITGEEYEAKAGDDFEWVIDPIDGTRAFMSGIPTWGTLVGLNHKGRPVLSMLEQPFTGERFFAADGQGSFLQHGGTTQAIKVRACGELGDAVLATTSPDLFTGTPGEASWHGVNSGVKLTRYGGDCYNYALVAMGQLDVVIEQGLKDVDIQPLVTLVEQAGGVITDWQGGPAHQGGQAIACGDAALHQKMLTLLND